MESAFPPAALEPCSIYVHDLHAASGCDLPAAEVPSKRRNSSRTEATASDFSRPSLCTALCSSMIIMVKGYVHLFPTHLPAPPSRAAARRAKANPCSSMCTGLFLVLRYDYMLLVFGISCLYEVVLTVLDYEMKILGRARYDSESPEKQAGAFAALMGHFGQATNLLSFVFSLFGFSFVVRRVGRARTLRVFPTLLVRAVASTLPSSVRHLAAVRVSGADVAAIVHHARWPFSRPTRRQACTAPRAARGS